MHFAVPQPLLVCTYTNVAVDNLVEGLAQAGVRPLRVGVGAKVRAALRAHTLEAKMAAHARQPVLAQLQADAERLREYMQAVEGRRRAAAPYGKQEAACGRMLVRLERALEGKKGRAWAVRREMEQEIVYAADVVRCVFYRLCAD